MYRGGEGDMTELSSNFQYLDTMCNLVTEFVTKKARKNEI